MGAYDDDFFLDGDAAVAAVEAAADGECVPIKGGALDRINKLVDDRTRAKVTTPLYFDLETCPDYSRLDSFGLDPVPLVPEAVPFDQLPEPVTIINGTAEDVKVRLAKIGIADPVWLSYVSECERIGKARKGVFDEIKKARQFRDDAIGAHEDRLKLLSTTPEYCSICAIAWTDHKHPVESLVVGEDVMPNGEVTTERAILETFWGFAAGMSPLIGYNIAAFDIPVLLTRSCLLGIEPSKQLDLSPWGSDVMDLYLKRFGPRGNTSRERPGKLKELCRCYGIDVPAGDCDGSMVAELMKSEGGRKKVGEYVASDVHVLRGFHRRLSGYFWV